MIGLEAMVNIAVVTGLIPTKGLPLPLISYGGTSMVINLVACALLFQASKHGERFTLESALGR
jgi:cell division protein FtsW